MLSSYILLELSEKNVRVGVVEQGDLASTYVLCPHSMDQVSNFRWISQSWFLDEGYLQRNCTELSADEGVQLWGLTNNLQTEV